MHFMSDFNSLQVNFLFFKNHFVSSTKDLFWSSRYYIQGVPKTHPDNEPLVVEKAKTSNFPEATMGLRPIISKLDKIHQNGFFASSTHVLNIRIGFWNTLFLILESLSNDFDHIWKINLHSLQLNFERLQWLTLVIIKIFKKNVST